VALLDLGELLDGAVVLHFVEMVEGSGVQGVGGTEGKPFDRFCSSLLCRRRLALETWKQSD
jgi:hypothetical protein